MASFQGIIRRNVVNLSVQNERLGVISDNFANMNTNAYKSVKFKQFVADEGYVDGVATVDHSCGSLMQTGKEFDVALNSSGYIPVTSKSGDVTYTRDGSFKTNKDGYLVTYDDCLVGDGIKLPANYENLLIKPDGSVYVVIEGGSEPEFKGKIPVVTFNNPSGLKQIDGNKYLATENSGEPVLKENHNCMEQGMRECANVDLYYDINEASRVSMAFNAGNQLLKVVNTLYKESVELQ